jgi:UDP-MurNAc hydroxylase
MCARYCVLHVKLEFLGHAGVLVEHGSTRIAMDAWFTDRGAFDGAWYQLPCNHHFATRDWSKLTLAIVSHEHLDHVDGEFLAALPDDVPIMIPRYPSPALARQIYKLARKTTGALASGRAHHFGQDDEVELRIWVEESPMNHDSVWVFKAGGHSFVHTVDSRLSPRQLDEILEFTGGRVDALAVQCAGASWFPLAYANIEPARKLALSQRKREHKLEYARSVAEHLRPTSLLLIAGPPAFLDPELRQANSDPSFPNGGQSKAWFEHAGYQGRVLAPLPGDRLDLASGELHEDPEAHAGFSWDRVPEYIEDYATRMAPTLAKIYAHADELVVADLDASVRQFFTRMLGYNRYFRERIDMNVLFDIEGEGGGKCLLRIHPDDYGVERWDDATPHQYGYRFHVRWLKRILVEDLHWEDFLLSLRFTAERNPDVYNDHLLGLLKFNHVRALEAVEQFERGLSGDTIEVRAEDGTRYEIAKYCPHAGASLEHAPIEGRRITCLLHHYVFDLDTGECLSGNCRLATRRIE